MLQRIQTLFLLGAILCQGGLFFFNIWSGTATAEYKNIPANESASLSILTLNHNYKGQIDNAFDARVSWILAGLDGVIIALTLVCVIMFNNRMRQNQVSRFLILLALAQTVLLVYFTEAVKKVFDEDTSSLQSIGGATFKILKDSYGIGIGLPVLSIIFFFLAGRFIMKDEKLVRSADRLR